SSILLQQSSGQEMAARHRGFAHCVITDFRRGLRKSPTADGQYLLEIGVAQHRLLDAVLEERGHASGEREVAHLLDGSAARDGALDVVVGGQQLVQADASLVAAAAAVVAAAPAPQLKLRPE